MASQPTLCATCGEEVRWGGRAGVVGWLHREDVDHAVILGQPFTGELREKAEAHRHVIRYREGKDGKQVAYTTAGVDALKISDPERRRAALEALPPTAPEHLEPGESIIEPIEVHRINLDRRKMSFPKGAFGPTGGVPGGARSLMNLAEKHGWEVSRLTYSRGPYMSWKGESLGVSDYVVLHVRRPGIDGPALLGVASWRDGKADCCYLATKESTRSLAVTELKDTIKEAPCGTGTEADD